eukprot:11255306-Heterocapsa_arctica.AAC.1
MSNKLFRKQLTLFGHLLRAPEDDLLKLCSVLPSGERVKANFKSVGRPHLKWFDGFRKIAIAELVTLQILPANHHLIMRPSEISPIILESAKERLL